MKSSKGGNNTLEDEEDYEEDFTSKREPTSSIKDAKNNDKVNAMRSKHSVTEQRRRSKINERFQILRDLMPHGDQKRDTASFLLEVIEYVQVLQEKVQKYEGPYEAWNTEPTKLMPWRHNHWRVQNLLGHPQAIKNGPGLAETFAGKFDEQSLGINPSLTVNAQTPVERDSIHESSFGISDEHLDLGENPGTMSTSFQALMPTVVRSDGDVSHLPQRPSTETLSSHCAIGSDDQIGEHMIEGGTISISSAYSHGLLTTLTQALQSSGVDLTHANISIRIDLGKRASQSSVSGITGPIPIPKEEANALSKDREIGSSKEEYGQPQKRLKS